MKLNFISPSIRLMNGFTMFLNLFENLSNIKFICERQHPYWVITYLRKQITVIYMEPEEMNKQESDWVQRVAVSSGAGWFPPATDWVAATHSRWDIPWNVYLQRCDSHLSVRAVSCFTPSLTLNIFSLK